MASPHPHKISPPRTPRHARTLQFSPPPSHLPLQAPAHSLKAAASASSFLWYAPPLPPWKSSLSHSPYILDLITAGTNSSPPAYPYTTLTLPWYLPAAPQKSTLSVI